LFLTIFIFFHEIFILIDRAGHIKNAESAGNGGKSGKWRKVREMAAVDYFSLQFG
jgi:hypothetical protein